MPVTRNMSAGLLDFADFETETAPRLRKVTKSIAAAIIFNGAPDRSIQAGSFDQQIAAGGGRNRRVGDRDFCDLGGAGSFSGLSLYGFWPIRGVFSIWGKLPFFCFTPYGFWALIAFFRDFGKMAVFLPFLLWFPGFRIAAESFGTLGALGRFLALPL